MSEERTGLDFWALETYHDLYRAGFRVKKILHSEKSEFQTIDIVETEGFGKMLYHDGFAMLSERDEHSYHEMMAHVPLFSHPHPKKVLIIGGGDGGTAREVLRHSSVEKCVMVEIDGAVVEACKKFIPQTASKLSDPKMELLIEDGVAYAKNCTEKFDVILVDSSDPIGPAAPLFDIEFYKNLSNLLHPEGIIVSQAESPYFDQKMQAKLLEITSSLFKITTLYNFSNVVYPGGLWSFSYASHQSHPLKNFDQTRFDELKLDLEYYHSGLHKACFEIPNFMKKAYQKYIQL